MNSNRPRIFITIILMIFIACSHGVTKKDYSVGHREWIKPADVVNRPNFEGSQIDSAQVNQIAFYFKAEGSERGGPFCPSPDEFIYSLPETCQVNIDVFNNSSIKVDSVDLGIKIPGFYKIKWNGKSVSSGIYWLKFSACDYSSAVRAIILK